MNNAAASHLPALRAYLDATCDAAGVASSTWIALSESLYLASSRLVGERAQVLEDAAIDCEERARTAGAA